MSCDFLTLINALAMSIQLFMFIVHYLMLTITTLDLKSILVHANINMN